MLTIAVGGVLLHSLPVDTSPSGVIPVPVGSIAQVAGGPVPNTVHMRATTTNPGGDTHRSCAGCDESDGNLLECLAVGCLAGLIVITMTWLGRTRLLRRWWPLGVAPPGAAAVSMILRVWVRPGPRLVELSISRT